MSPEENITLIQRLYDPRVAQRDSVAEQEVGKPAEEQKKDVP